MATPVTTVPDIAATLAWLPHYPDRLFPAQRLATPAHLVVASNLDPIGNPAPPTPTVWLPTFPAQVTIRKLPAADRQFYASGSPFLGTALRAHAIFPAVLPRRRRQTAQTQTFEIGGVLDVPKIGGWRTRFPDYLVRRRRLTGGGGVWVVDPTTLINAAPCIELTAETLTPPALTTETVVSPVMIEETFVSPTLSEEDLC